MLRKLLIYIRALILLPKYFLKLNFGKSLNLNIGSGIDYRDNFINIDMGCNFKVDFISDGISALKICKNDSVDTIIMSHIVNYMYIWEFEELLSVCKLKLSKRGKIIFENPDLDLIIKNLNYSEPLSFDFFESIRGIFAFADDDILNKKRYFPYKMAYRSKDLIKILQKYGYNFEIQKPQIHFANYDRDIRIIISK